MQETRSEEQRVARNCRPNERYQARDLQTLFKRKDDLERSIFLSDRLLQN